MNTNNKKDFILCLLHHYGEKVKCKHLCIYGEDWVDAEIEINYHFIAEFEKGYIKDIQIVKRGVEIIALERQRQITEEGWDTDHDLLANNNEQLARAGALYALPDTFRTWGCDVDNMWPWDKNWWKPTPDDRIKELAKAGALIAAEIDRLLISGE